MGVSALEVIVLIHKLSGLILPVLMVCLGATLAESQGQKPAASEKSGPDFSGMYSFLREGEFVQLTIEDAGKVTGFVSRYGDTESDRGVFLDHFFKQGKLEGNHLSFTTDTVHGVSYEFRGSVERGEGKTAGDEAYYVLKGMLVETSVDEGKKTSARNREVALKMFPQDLGAKK